MKYAHTSGFHSDDGAVMMCGVFMTFIHFHFTSKFSIIHSIIRQDLGVMFLNMHTYFAAQHHIPTAVLFW